MIGWINTRPIDVDYFSLLKSRKSNVDLSYFLDKIDLDKYFIYKASNTFRQVQKEEIGKYVGCIFFNKELYKKEYIDKWIVEIKKISKNKFQYLAKPFPRIGVINKIELI